MHIKNSKLDILKAWIAAYLRDEAGNVGLGEGGAGEGLPPGEDMGEPSVVTEGEPPETDSADSDLDEGDFDPENFLNGLDDEDGDANPDEANQEATEETPQGLLDQIRAWNIERNGNPLEIRDEAHAQELLRHGADYTYKSQQLAEERKTFEGEMEALKESHAKEVEAFQEEYAQVQDSLIDNDIFGSILKGMEQTGEPLSFEEIQSAFQTQKNQYLQSINNPVVQGLKDEMKALKEANQARDDRDLNTATEGVQKEWQDGSKELQGKFGAQLTKLGVKMDLDQAHKMWLAGNQGGLTMTPKQAFFATHGDAINKARAAKQKAAETARNSSQRRGGAVKKPKVTSDEVIGDRLGISAEAKALEDAWDEVMAG